MLKICSISGHRSIPTAQLPQLEKHLEAELLQLIQNGFTEFRAGGALGFDTLAAKTVLRLRDQHPQIRLVLCLPCQTQTVRWTPEEQAVYQEILKQADGCVYTSKNYFPGCMQKRNRALVDGSNLLLCYLTKPNSGTAYTVQYAQKSRVAVLNIAGFLDDTPDHLKHVVDFFQRGMVPFLVLSVLRKQPQTSYQIRNQLKTDDLPVVHGPSFYTNLFRMEQKQYIITIRFPEESGRHVYLLFSTAYGEAYYKRLCAAYDSASHNLQKFIKCVSSSY